MNNYRSTITFFVVLTVLLSLHIPALPAEEYTSASLTRLKQTLVSGHVFDSQGSPLAGVTVRGKGTGAATSTDQNGSFSMLAAENDVLFLSMLGYITQEVEVKGRSTLRVTLLEDSRDLDEVVVIGYGTSRVKDLTGSVAAISSKDFQQGSITNAEQLIANKLPGVQVTPISGRPGTGSSIKIRGGASLNASNDPLIVVDGVPIEGGDGTSGPGILSSLNPADIESFTVLRDASASAIYGARASNGVILITTKKGSAHDKLTVGLSNRSSLSMVREKAPVLSAEAFKEAAALAAADVGISIDDLRLGTADTDWQDQIYKPAMIYDNNIRFTGGINGLPYRLSLGYLNQDGVLRTGNYQRTNALINVDPALFNRHLKISVSAKGSLENERIANEEAITAAVRFNPTHPVHDANSPYGGYFEYYNAASNPALLHGHYNPVGLLEQYDNNNKWLRSVGNLRLDYKAHFLPDLHVNINTGYDVGTARAKNYVSENAFKHSLQRGLSFDQQYASSRNTYFEGYFSYATRIESIKSSVDAVIGYSYNDFLTTRYNYPTMNALGEKIEGTDPVYPFDSPQHTLISSYARFNYRYDDRYLLTATVRRDGSSRFSEDHRWGVFPSVALAWRMDHENFLIDNPTVSELKLRAGFGVTGQQDGIDNYAYIPLYFQGSGQDMYLFGNSGYFHTTFPSATDFNRKWEQTTTANLGIDFGLFGSRLTGSVDIYHKNTTDLLNTVNIPMGANFASSITKNIGSMENKGVELLLTGQPVATDKLTWDVSFNIANNRNRITKLYMGDDSEVGLTSGGNQVNTVGFSRNVWYMYQQVYGTDGLPLEDVMVDRNGDGVVNSEDLYRSKSSLPNYLMGFSTTVTFNRITAGLAMHANFGQYLAFMPLDNLSAINSNVANGLVPLNLSTDYYKSRFRSNANQYQSRSDYYLQNASFLKLDNMYLNYNFGNVFKANGRNAVLRLNASVQNLFTMTKYTGRDPEASGNGGWENGYPVPRIYSLGFDIQF